MTDAKMYEDMMLGGEITKVEVTTLPVEELELDPTNPRIQYRLKYLANGKDLDSVILDMPEVKELLKDIEGNSGLRERPYVQFNRETQKYKVIEGNCRTVCISHLHKRYTTNALWNRVPVRIFEEDLSGKKIAIFLSDQHVSGKIAWKSHEQAGQIYRMVHDHEMTIEEVARYLRIKKTQVELLNKTYDLLLNRFVQIDDGIYARDGEGKFSYFYSALNRKGIREAFEANDDLVDDFCRWVGAGRFPKSSDVIKLDEILKHPEAMNAWRSGSPLDEVMTIASADQPIFKHLKQVQEDCGALQLSEIERFASNYNERQLFVEARDGLNRVIETIEQRSAPIRQAAE